MFNQKLRQQTQLGWNSTLGAKRSNWIGKNSEGWTLTPLPYFFVLFLYVLSTHFNDIPLKKCLIQEHRGVEYLNWLYYNLDLTNHSWYKDYPFFLMISPFNIRLIWFHSIFMAFESISPTDLNSRPKLLIKECSYEGFALRGPLSV